MGDTLLTVSMVVLWVLVLLLGVLLLGLSREVGVLYRRYATPGALMTEEGISINSAAPDIAGVELPSEQPTLFAARSDMPSLVLFVSPGCPMCREVMDAIKLGRSKWEQDRRLQVVCEGDLSTVRAFCNDIGYQGRVMCDPNVEIRTLYGSPSTPHAFLVRADGTVQLKGIVNSRDDIDRMIDGEARLANGRPVRADPTVTQPTNETSEISSAWTGGN